MGSLRCATTERGAVFAASLLLPLAGLALHVLGLRRTLRLFSSGANPAQAPAREHAEHAEHAEHVARAVEHAGRKYSIYPADCLVRSLVVMRLLRRRGLAAELRIGVRTLIGRFEAHAWVEHCGTPLGADADEARVFHAFDLPRAGSVRPR